MSVQTNNEKINEKKNKRGDAFIPLFGLHSIGVIALVLIAILVLYTVMVVYIYKTFNQAPNETVILKQV